MPNPRAEEFKAKGNSAFSSKNFDEAIEYYTKAISIDNTNHIYFSNRSAAYGGLNRFADALNDAEKCIEINPSWGKGYYRKAIALLGLMRLDDAVLTLNKGLEKDPNNNDIKTKLQEVKADVAKQKRFYAPDGTLLTGAAALKAEGNDYFKNGKYEEAIKCYTAALAANPEPSEKEKATLYSNRAACYSQFQNWHEMERDCTRCLAIDPKNAKALIRRGLAYEGLEKYKLALADMKAVMEIEPTSMQASQAISRLTRAVNSM